MRFNLSQVRTSTHKTMWDTMEKTNPSHITTQLFVQKYNQSCHQWRGGTPSNKTRDWSLSVGLGRRSPEGSTLRLGILDVDLMKWNEAKLWLRSQPITNQIQQLPRQHWSVWSRSYKNKSLLPTNVCNRDDNLFHSEMNTKNLDIELLN